MAFRPFQDRDLSLGTLQNEMNRLFDRVWHSGVSTGPFDGQEWGPAVDVYESADRYLIFVELPGVDAGAVEVSHVGGRLTIRGAKTKPAGVSGEDEVVQCERRYGNFCRTIDLPTDVDTEKLTASSQGGVLELCLPKSVSSQPRSVKIDVKEG